MAWKPSSNSPRCQRPYPGSCLWSRQFDHNLIGHSNDRDSVLLISFLSTASDVSYSASSGQTGG